MDRGSECRRSNTAPVPAALAELARYARPRGLRWEPPQHPAVARRPTGDELEILTALRALGVLSTPQLHRRFMPHLSARAVRHRLQAMAEQGWLRRGHLICAGPGQTPRLCALDAAGRDVVSVEGPLTGSFEFHAQDVLEVVHALRVAAWWFAFEHLLGSVVTAACRPPAPAPDLVLRMGHAQLGVAFVRSSDDAGALDRLASRDDDALLLVAPDEPSAIALAQTAGRSSWSHRAYFTAEAEVHAQRLRALRLRSDPKEIVRLDLRRRLSQTAER